MSAANQPSHTHNYNLAAAGDEYRSVDAESAQLRAFAARGTAAQRAVDVILDPEFVDLAPEEAALAAVAAERVRTGAVLQRWRDSLRPETATTTHIEAIKEAIDALDFYAEPNCWGDPNIASQTAAKLRALLAEGSPQ